MRQFIAKSKKWVGYLFFCIIMAIVLLYYRFPSDALRNYLQATVNRLNNSVTLTIGDIKPSFPPAIQLERPGVFFKGEPSKRLFRADSLLIKPNFWSFIKGKEKYCFECFLYRGDVTGCVNFKKNSMELPFDTEIELKNIDIAEYEYIKNLIGWQVDGILYASIFYNGQQRSLMDGTGEANLQLLDGKIDLLVPILNLESIQFDKIDSSIVLKKQTINLKRLELTGPLLKSTLSGTIRLKKEFKKSILNLKGTIIPFASFFKSMGDVSKTMNYFKQRMKKGALYFIIYGTLVEPKIRFT